MATKLERISVKLEKLREKRGEIDEEIKRLEAEYTAEENLEAGDVLRLYKLKPEELAEFLKNRSSSLPGDIKNEDAFMEKDDDGHVDDEEDKETYEKY